MRLNSALPLLMIFLFISNLQAQSSSDYTFSKDINSLIAKKNYNNVIAYSVISKQYVDSTTTASTKVESEAYKNASAEVRRRNRAVRAVQTKIKEEESKNSVDPFVTDLNKLKSNINSFLTSQSGFESNKQLLIDSQKISDTYGLGYLLYADSNINSKFKTKFFVLSKNKVALKIHLRKVAAKIKAVETPAPPAKKNYDAELNSAKQKLKTAKDRLNNTKRYDIIPGETSVQRYAEVELGDRIFKPENVIIGNFEIISEYYIVRDERANLKMVSAEDAQQDKLINQDFVHESKFIYVKNKFSKETYLVHNGFMLEQYAYTKEEPRSVENKK